MAIATPQFFVNNNAFGVSKACRNSKACMAAVAAEEEANKNAQNAAKSANLYQIKVNELAAEIARKEAEIAETKADIDDLNKQIKEAEEKLKEDQDALAELLVNMHFEGDAEPITILAGSNSISDLAEKQAREEVIKQEISAAAAAVKDAKAKLEEDKKEVENLLSQQKAAKEGLVAAKAEQQSIVKKYKNDANAYAAAAKKAKEEKLAAEKAEQDAHPELYGGSSFSGDDTYPWQNDCPGRQDDYTTYRNGYAIGGYVCECVSYVGWKAYEEYGLYLSWGNAYNWDDAAYYYGYKVDHNPTPGSIGQTNSGEWGHVFWVESVNSDGSINVTEYNNSYATFLYSGYYRYGSFGARRISKSDLWQFNFIHLD